MICGNISVVSIWTILSILIQIYYISLGEGSLPSICSKIDRHVAWDYINPFQVQAWANTISFFTTIISPDTTTVKLLTGSRCATCAEGPRGSRVFSDRSLRGSRSHCEEQGEVGKWKRRLSVSSSASLIESPWCIVSASCDICKALFVGSQL